VERHAIGQAVLRSTNLVTRLVTLKSAPAVGVRNVLAAFLTRLRPVRRRIARAISETALDYTDGPLGRDFNPHLSLVGHSLTRPGSFAPAFPGLTGDTFTLVVARSAAHIARRQLARFQAFMTVLGIDVETDLARNCGIAADTVLVVRPDLYIGARGTMRQLGKIGEYLDALVSGGRPPRPAHEKRSLPAESSVSGLP
jgi:hypothetical protein